MNEIDTINADTLTNKPVVPEVVPPPQSQDASSFVSGLEPVITSAQKQYDEMQKGLETARQKEQDNVDKYLRLAESSGIQNVYQDQLNKQARTLGYDGADSLMTQMRDANVNLARLQGKYRTAEQATSGRQGQSKAFESVQLDELGRQSAVEVGNAAILSQALAGNYETARQTALDTANFASQDRQNKLTAYLEQARRAYDVADEAQKAFITQKAEQAKLELQEIQDTKKLTESAIVSGVATPQELVKLSSANVPNAEKQALANEILARGAGEDREMAISDRELDRQYKQAQINASNALASQRTNSDTGAVGAEYANDMDALVGNITAMIPTKFGQQQFQKQILSARNDADRLGLVAGQVLKAQPAEVRRDFANQAVGLSEIDRAIKLLDEGTETGVLQAGAQYVYNLAGKDYDPKLAEINQHLISAIQPYRNSVTGAAWGTQEDAEYAQLFGSTKYSPDEFKARLEVVKEVLKNKSAATLNAFANPMGVGENQFASGAYTPDNQTGQNIVTAPDGTQVIIVD